MIVLELRRAVYLAIIDEIDKSSKITKLVTCLSLHVS